MNDFKIRDIVFLAVLAALTLLISAPIMIAVASIEIFALRNATSAIIFSMSAAIALRRVPYMGTMTIFGIFTGGPLLLISSIMFFNQFLGGLIADFIVRFIYRDYSTRRAISVGSKAFIPATLPVTFLMTLLTRETSYTGILGSAPIALVSVILTFVLSYLGSNLGMKIADELEKAGSL